uniref:Uncharacterized protein n=1 Tax=Opuntia streptacantha TaxID=393608 RepID=A0A7C9A2G7_OPUST
MLESCWHLRTCMTGVTATISHHSLFMSHHLCMRTTKDKSILSPMPLMPWDIFKRIQHILIIKITIKVPIKLSILCRAHAPGLEVSVFPNKIVILIDVSDSILSIISSIVTINSPFIMVISMRCVSAMSSMCLK